MRNVHDVTGNAGGGGGGGGYFSDDICDISHCMNCTDYNLLQSLVANTTDYNNRPLTWYVNTILSGD